MTEDKIKKGLERDMRHDSCKSCPYEQFKFPYCRHRLFQDVTSLMNSKSAEIEYYKQMASQRKPVSNMGESQ